MNNSSKALFEYTNALARATLLTDTTPGGAISAAEKIEMAYSKFLSALAEEQQIAETPNE